MTTHFEHREQYLNIASMDELTLALKSSGFTEAEVTRIKELWAQRNAVKGAGSKKEKPNPTTAPAPAPVKPTAEEDKVMRKVIDETFTESR